MPAQDLQQNEKIIIIEPNNRMGQPYSFLPPYYTITRLSTIENASKAFDYSSPHVAFLSASFSPSKTLRFLEMLKNASTSRLIPLVIVVDLGNRINFVPGTSWGRRIAVVDCFIPKSLFLATLKRVVQKF